VELRSKESFLEQAKVEKSKDTVPKSEETLKWDKVR